MTIFAEESTLCSLHRERQALGREYSAGEARALAEFLVSEFSSERGNTMNHRLLYDTVSKAFNGLWRLQKIPCTMK